MNYFLQWLIVTVVITVCVAQAVQHVWPNMMWRGRAKVSYWLETSSRFAWAQWFGRYLRPKVTMPSRGCRTGCAVCTNCVSESAGGVFRETSEIK